MDLESRLIDQAGFRRIRAVDRIIDRLPFGNLDRDVDLFRIAAFGIRKFGRLWRILTKHDLEFLRAVRILRSRFHQRQRFRIVAFILVNLDQIPVSARMRGRNLIDQRRIYRLCILHKPKLCIGLSHENQCVHIIRLTLNGDLQFLKRTGKIGLLIQFASQRYISVCAGDRPSPCRHHPLAVLRLEEHISAGRHDKQRQQQNHKQHPKEPLMRFPVDWRIHERRSCVRFPSSLAGSPPDSACVRHIPCLLFAQSDRDIAGAALLFPDRNILIRHAGCHRIHSDLIAFALSLFAHFALLRTYTPRNPDRLGRFRNISIAVSSSEYALYSGTSRTDPGCIRQFPTTVWTDHGSRSSS